jgi:hypothetical protein
VTGATLSTVYVDKVTKPIFMDNVMQQLPRFIQLHVVPIFRIIIRDPMLARGASDHDKDELYEVPFTPKEITPFFLSLK